MDAESKLDQFLDDAIDTYLVFYTPKDKPFVIIERRPNHIILLNTTNRKSKTIMVKKSELIRLILEHPYDINLNTDSSRFFNRFSPIQADSYIPTLYAAICSWFQENVEDPAVSYINSDID